MPGVSSQCFFYSQNEIMLEVVNYFTECKLKLIIFGLKLITGYAYTLKVEEKSDVYSFEAGKKPVGEFGDRVDIVKRVNETISEIFQPSSGSEFRQDRDTSGETLF
ncbi:hypothetical protein L6452_37188 [Arctium lappa]|uniref:Uncharacterized protein n=1 Tax=Arctium lappa TaxID=4217 RepID=A0ACB8Y3F7_ARCLA|nr:hypothetical protein L6452_37188 [Arctium lappa]